MAALALFATFGPARFIIVRNGYQSIRRGILNQDILVSASALGGLIGGVVGFLIPSLPSGGFFGATVFVLAFHLIGGYVSVLVHVRASHSVRRLLSLESPTARRIEANENEDHGFHISTPQTVPLPMVFLTIVPCEHILQQETCGGKGAVCDCGCFCVRCIAVGHTRCYGVTSAG